MQDFVKANCQRTCGYCPTSTTAPASALTVATPAPEKSCASAVDSNANCASWVQNGFCSNTFYTMEQRKTLLSKLQTSNPKDSVLTCFAIKGKKKEGISMRRIASDDQTSNSNGDTEHVRGHRMYRSTKTNSISVGNTVYDTVLRIILSLRQESILNFFLSNTSQLVNEIKVHFSQKYPLEKRLSKTAFRSKV
ncbi:unnamed protein product [Strongylus vulgaris]|uniref:ShKT domain-containing protein n=1 Tax=Strongylus vulgaris TaxID=40348 RepID=A0A3P7ICQ2_STRVU|nr:unnamed protein product [Strongylus vulgaris]